ncbi:MAG: peptidoglycan-binding domain-containing protein [Paracoccaceae bacterium]
MGSFGEDAQGLTFKERKELQERLTKAGFDTDGADGVIGDKTTLAIRAYEACQGARGDRARLEGAARPPQAVGRSAGRRAPPLPPRGDAGGLTEVSLIPGREGASSLGG